MWRLVTNSLASHGRPLLKYEDCPQYLKSNPYIRTGCVPLPLLLTVSARMYIRISYTYFFDWKMSFSWTKVFSKLSKFMTVLVRKYATFLSQIPPITGKDKSKIMQDL